MAKKITHRRGKDSGMSFEFAIMGRDGKTGRFLTATPKSGKASYSPVSAKSSFTSRTPNEALVATKVDLKLPLKADPADPRAFATLLLESDAIIMDILSK